MTYRFRLLFIGVLLISGSVYASVFLESFEAALLEDGSVEVMWETGSERDTAGFYIQRSVDIEVLLDPSTAADPSLRVNEALIPGRGDTTSGASYSLIDDDTLAGETYYYMLLEITFSGDVVTYPGEIVSVAIQRNFYLPLLQGG